MDAGNNMLGSTAMCFNIFGPLKDDHELATGFLVASGLPNDIGNVHVQFEYAPDPAPLADNTSFDAFFSYTRPGGKKGFVGIETKLTEPFSRAKYGFDARYSQYQTDKWWKPNTETRFSETKINQLWRNHLLAYAMLQAESPYTEGYHAVVYHGNDTACSDSISEYTRLLTDAGARTLLDWQLDDVVERIAVKTREHREWLNAFRLRYLHLGASEATWLQRDDGRGRNVSKD